MKKLFSIFVFAILAVALSVTALAADSDIVASGYCGGEGDGTNLTWTITGDGTLTISGEGAMADYMSYKNFAPWLKYSEAKYLVIEEGITSIGNWAFYNMSWLKTKLVLPDSLENFGIYAFYGCWGLTGKLIIPNGVATIGEGTFFGCSGFDRYLVIPEGVTEIGCYAFEGCSGFVGNLVIPKSVTTIGHNAFSGCSGFVGNLVIPESVTTIGSGAFKDCSGFSGNIIIPEKVRKIESETFFNCTGFNGTLILRESVEEIKEAAFHGCNSLNSIVLIPKSVDLISLEAFTNCSIDIYYFQTYAPMLEYSNSLEGETCFPYFDADDTIYYPSGDYTWIIEDSKWYGYTAIPYDTLPSFEPEATLSISSEKLILESKTTLSVSLSENSNAVMAQFAVKYDSENLEIVSASAGELMSDALINIAEEGVVYFAWDGDNPVTEAGEILNITFTTTEDAVPGEYPVEIDTTKEFVFSKSNSVDLNVEIKNGKITVIEGLCGDLNGDEKVNIKDAYLARLIAAKLIVPTDDQLLLGDVDLDGKITAIDANIIRKYCVRIIKELPVKVS